MSALLEVDDLHVEFRLSAPPFRAAPRVRAVDGVSLRLTSGEVRGVVGESGSGKTTLGRAILRLQPVTRGRIRLAGQPIERLTDRQLRPVRRRMQAVFQDPTASLDPTMRIGDTVAEGLRAHRIGTAAERRDQVAAMLDRVGLPLSAAAKRPAELSGGQRQRVGIARALVMRPELLVADEAVSALDVSVQAGVVNLLMDLAQEMGLALLFIAHDLDLVRHFCDTVTVMYLGRVMESGPTSRVFALPRHPYTRALMLAVPRLRPGAVSSTFLPMLPGEPPSPLDPPGGCVFRTRCPYAIAACAGLVPPLAGGAHQAACLRQEEI